MNIAALASNLQVNPSLLPVPPKGAGSAEEDKGFADLLGDMVSKVNGMQKSADQAVSDVMTGKITDIHQVSVKVQEASVAFDLMLGVRNQLMQAFEELSKIQA